MCTVWHLYPLTQTPSEATKRYLCEVRLRLQVHIQMGSDTGWLGIPGHGVGVREVRGSIPGGTTLFVSAVSPGG